MRPLIEDLDRLPFPDYDLFPYECTENYLGGRGYRIISVQASRGCPYRCAYCCNQFLRDLYPGRNKYMRFRSVSNVISELKFLRTKYPGSNFVRFEDDTLSSDKDWFYAFTEEYKKHINLPYSTNDHVHNISEKIARSYRDSGCVSVKMGIENGNVYIRNKIMKRPFSDDEIISAFRILRSENILVGAYNIIGFCHETMDTVLDTVKLNAKCSPDIIFKSYFQPFKGTEAYFICRELGLNIRELKTSFFQEPAVELSEISDDQLIFGFSYFEILVRCYKLMYLVSGGKESTLIRFVEKILTSRTFPYTLFNKVIISRMKIKEWFPRLAYILGQMKKMLVKPRF